MLPRAPSHMTRKHIQSTGIMSRCKKCQRLNISSPPAAVCGSASPGGAKTPHRIKQTWGLSHDTGSTYQVICWLPGLTNPSSGGVSIQICGYVLM